MGTRVILAELQVEIPEDADSATVSKLIWQAGQRVMQEAMRQSLEDPSEPQACARCGKRGRSEAGR